MRNEELQSLLSENIIALLGLESLPTPEKISLLEKMTELVQKRVMVRVLQELKDEDKNEMLEKEQNPQEALVYIADKVPNLEEIVKDEVSKLKEEMLLAVEQAA